MQKNILPLFSIGLITLSMSAWGDAMIYKCRNQQGDIIYQKSACTENADAVTSWTPKLKAQLPAPEPEKKPRQELIIKQSDSGHYLLDGSVNDKGLTFVVDTGASVVSLPNTIADSAGISCKNTIAMDTANGATQACTTTITKLKIGNFVIKDALATIVPNLKQPLLGMNILQRFNMTQANGEMRLTARN